MKKALGLTVRDLKKEVNKKVLKVPSIEQKILRVANNDSDGETSSARPSSKSNSKTDMRRNTNPKYRVDEFNEPSPRFPGIRQ